MEIEELEGTGGRGGGGVPVVARKAIPVGVSILAICSGVPVAMILPPLTPAPGPISMIQSAALMTPI